jgi:hypothetical protein
MPGKSRVSCRCLSERPCSDSLRHTGMDRSILTRHACRDHRPEPPFAIGRPGENTGAQQNAACASSSQLPPFKVLPFESAL